MFRSRTFIKWLWVIVFGLFAGCGYINEPRVILEEKREVPLHTPIWSYGEWVIARGSVHNHTTYSDGCRSPEDLIQLAHNEGIAVLAITDHREGRLCAGKKEDFCVNMGGVDSKKVGYKKYFEHLNRLAEESQMPIVLVGLEVAPNMWNEGYFPWMTIKASHWHFTTYGIENFQVYEKMPARKELKMKPEPDPGLSPFQNFVDYIVNSGGLVFQAHPESKQYSQYYNLVYLLEGAPAHLTARLNNLTGVAVLPSGYREVGNPGGEWDKAQLQYLVGIRDKPLWGWGEADYHCGELGLRNASTLFYLRDFSKTAVFDAIKKGKMVAFSGEVFQEVYVKEFSVSEDGSAKEKIMFGEKVRLSSPAVVRFSLSQEVRIKEARLIRNGQVIWRGDKADFEYRDNEGFKEKITGFYRVELIGEEDEEEPVRLFTNPIFVYWR